MVAFYSLSLYKIVNMLFIFDYYQYMLIAELDIGSSDMEHEENLRQLASNAKSLEDSVRKEGIKGLLAITKHNLDNWETEKVNIAVTGRPGVGKSTFINAIRGDVQPYSGVYAPVGHRETTDKAAPYPHPDNQNLVFWDLPGAGTDNFPRKTYITDKRVNFRSYDIYIIIASDRFTEDETWLAGEIQKLGKTFLFVRTKVDVEIYNEELRMKSKADPQKTVQEIRDDCKQKLKAFKGFDETRDLYLIGSLQPTHPLLDFDKLCRRLVNALPALKGDALLYSLNFMAPEILEAKANALRQRIWRICVLSSMSGAVPIPGVSLVVDAALIAEEAQVYRITKTCPCNKQRFFILKN